MRVGCTVRCAARVCSSNGAGGSGKFDYICARKLRFGAASCAVANLAGQRADAAVCRELARLAAELWAGADAKERQEGLAEAAGEALQPEAGADLATHAAEADAEGGWANRLPAGGEAAVGAGRRPADAVGWGDLGGFLAMKMALSRH